MKIVFAIVIRIVDMQSVIANDRHVNSTDFGSSLPLFRPISCFFCYFLHCNKEIPSDFGV